MAFTDDGLVDEHDVYYAQMYKHNVLVLGTTRGVFTHKHIILDIMAMLGRNENFLMLEKNLLVNLSHVKVYDSYMAILYFSDYYKSKDAPQIRVKGISMGFIKKRFGAEKDVTEHRKSKFFSCATKKIMA